MAALEKRCRKMLFQKVKIYGNKKKIDRKKKERIRSPKNRILTPPMVRRVLKVLSEKVSFCALLGRCRKASLAVETALVLPLFFLGMVTLISFMDIYRIQTEHLQTLCERTKEAGMHAYVPNGKGPGEITLPDLYSYSPIGALVPLPTIRMYNFVKVHAWTGADETEFSGETTENEEMVYVTGSGTVYHKSPGCRYLNVSVNQISGSSVSHVRNSNGKKYRPCEICSRNQRPSGVVYVTSSGDRYHNLATCSGLKRTVRLVKVSQLKGMHACSRCG